MFYLYVSVLEDYTNAFVWYAESFRALQLPDLLYEKLNILSHSKAKNPEFLLYEDRLKTYTQWSFSSIVSPKDLAQSGFFYTNNLDVVKCFCCGLYLHNWTIFHKPDAQHKHFRKQCLYLKFREGSLTDMDHLKTCVICMDKKIHYAFLPCGHVCACHYCLIQITKSPLCKKEIEALRVVR